MRIIGGEHRGRLIAAPPGRGTRPMLDRVREALFSTLTSRLGGFEDLRVLDLFSGSGSLGLEALSRGAAHARFVERDARAAALLKRNAETLGVEERATVVRADALAPASWGEEAADVVFLDPPYALLERLDTRQDVLAALRGLVSGKLGPAGVLVFHAPGAGPGEDEFGPGIDAGVRRYGAQALWYVTRADPTTPTAGGPRSSPDRG
ncbi:MAG: 16S rRNA (guanine(966)-N(2))-methyltransferase RsmD [Planctomycetota bacterium]|nr:16S rRNA (guanine(966)-N(2))-methyltransferase RsmD [Planctomycetota bacterium]